MSCAIAVLIMVGVLFVGCSSAPREPVYGWNWTGPVPDGFYLVRRGDSLSLVAQKLGVSARSITKWNRLRPPYTIYADTLLRVEPPGRSRFASRVTDTKKTGVERQTSGGRSLQRVNQSDRSLSARSTVPRPDASARVTKAPEVTSIRDGSSGVRWDWPLNGPLLQRFRQGDRTRQGIRIGGGAGDRVRASADGRVVYSGSGLKGYGKLIIVKHDQNFLSAYGFNRTLFVTEGDDVKRGQVLAEVGQGAEGNYLLHFEVRRDGTAVDPILYLPQRN